MGSRGSSLSVVTRLHDGRPGFDSQQGRDFFSSPLLRDRLSDPPNWYCGFLPVPQSLCRMIYPGIVTFGLYHSMDHSNLLCTWLMLHCYLTWVQNHRQPLASCREQKRYQADHFASFLANPSASRFLKVEFL